METHSRIDHKLVLETYHRLGTQKAVATELGMSQSHVSKILRDHGVLIGKGSKTRKVDPDEVIRLWQELGNQHEVARLLHVNQTTISQTLKRRGLGTGKIGRAPTHPLPMNEVTQRYLAGETTRDLAMAFDVDDEVIRRRLARRGVQRRVGGASGHEHPNWKGGRSQVEWYRRQSYEVAAICLGRPLPPGLIIHHVDENPQNNDPPNLVIFRTQSAHFRFHQLLSRLQRTGQPIDATRLALENGALALPLPPNPIVFGPDTELFGPSEMTA